MWPKVFIKNIFESSYYLISTLGVMSEYNQDAALYGAFTVLNGFLGVTIFFFHSTGNERVREKLDSIKKKMAMK